MIYFSASLGYHESNNHFTLSSVFGLLPHLLDLFHSHTAPFVNWFIAIAFVNLNVSTSPPLLSLNLFFSLSTFYESVLLFIYNHLKHPLKPHCTHIFFLFQSIFLLDLFTLLLKNPFKTFT